MRKAMCLVIGLAGPASAYLIGRVAPPSISQTGFFPATRKLGNQPWGVTIPFEFTFRNGTGRSVTIKDIRTSCPCAVLNKRLWLGRVNPSGDSVVLAGSIKAGLTPGDAERSVTVETEGGQKYSAVLSLSVRPTYRLTPSSLTFSVLEDEGASEDEVLFESDTIQLVGIPTSSTPWATVSVVDNRILITIEPAKVPRSGRTFGRVTVQTTDPKMPVAVIPVSVTKLSSINLYPSRAYLIGSRSAAHAPWKSRHSQDMLPA